MNFKNHFRLLLLPLQLWLLLHRLPLQLLSQLRLLLQLQLPLQLQLLLQLEFTRWTQRPFQILLLFIFPNLKIIFVYPGNYNYNFLSSPNFCSNYNFHYNYNFHSNYNFRPNCNFHSIPNSHSNYNYYSSSNLYYNYNFYYKLYFRILKSFYLFRLLLQLFL
jgi:hypothetical protein